MKNIGLQLPVADVKRALAVVRPIIEGVSRDLDYLRCVYFLHDWSGVALIASDFHTHVHVRLYEMPVQGDAYALLLDFDELWAALKIITAGTVIIRGSVGEGATTKFTVVPADSGGVSADGGGVECSSPSVAQYPKHALKWPEHVAQESLWRMPLTEFRTGAESVSYAAERDGTWKNLCGLVVEESPSAWPSRLRFAASDTYRIATYVTSAAGVTIGASTVRTLVPNAAVDAILAAAKGFAAQGIKDTNVWATVYTTVHRNHVPAPGLRAQLAVETVEPGFVVLEVGEDIEIRTEYVEPRLPKDLARAELPTPITNWAVVDRNRLRSHLYDAGGWRSVELQSSTKDGVPVLMGAMRGHKSKTTQMFEMLAELGGGFSEPYDTKYVGEALKALKSKSVRLTFTEAMLFLDDPEATGDKALHTLAPLRRPSKLEAKFEKLVESAATKKKAGRK